MYSYVVYQWYKSNTIRNETGLGDLDYTISGSMGHCNGSQESPNSSKKSEKRLGEIQGISSVLED